MSIDIDVDDVVAEVVVQVEPIVQVHQLVVQDIAADVEASFLTE